MKIILQPEKHFIHVEDTINLPKTMSFEDDVKLHFFLHHNLKVLLKTEGVEISLSEKPIKQYKHHQALQLKQYNIQLSKGIQRFTLAYEGVINHPLEPLREEYARSFSETPGLINNTGIFLSRTTFWYPNFNEETITFTLDVHLPSPWNVVSQGQRVYNLYKNDGVDVRWKSSEPQEEIYLVGGKFTEYSRTADGINIFVFLRSPDEKLAKQYMETTAIYLKMYNNLFGRYPYKKFALVENFWETGYGMPSFTLLGSKVIRLPFILYSSYPHEILHNWWGNGVFVDTKSGNWCEGLTAYLADHLIQEQRGNGAAYRRGALQKYTDYAAKKKDFPLTEFHFRHSPASEAIGYGKSLMFFHMMRQELGDKLFIEALRTFYEKKKFIHASFADLKDTFSEISGGNYDKQFAQWLTQPGAPELKITQSAVKKHRDGYRLTALIQQVQKGPPYLLHLPVAFSMNGYKSVFQNTIFMNNKQIELSFDLPKSPLRIDIDPEYDLFRKLNRRELPPSLSHAFGSEKAFFILPASTDKKAQKAYQQFAVEWKLSKHHQIDVQFDSDVHVLPTDSTVWFFDLENRFQKDILKSLSDYNITVTEQYVDIQGKKINRLNHSFVIASRNPENMEQAFIWLMADNLNALSGLVRKLPHYGKYSYLGFKGSEPTNIAKGQWPILNSPLSVKVSQQDHRDGASKKKYLVKRQALADLPPVFSKERLSRDIQWLTSEEREGRGFGTSGLDQAAEYIAQQFRKAGLQPGGDGENPFFQTWNDIGGISEKKVILKNIIGIIPGKKETFKGESVVIGAHYDHLGLGWPDVHEGDEGKIHPGADDNASGVVVLLELARILVKTLRPDRTVVFIALTGEESGRRGSKYYVKNEKRFPVQKCIAMLNLDTIGRLDSKKLLIFGTGSAREWNHIFMGVSFVTGIDFELVAQEYSFSDQKSFLDANIPAVQLTSGPHQDYHRPTDRAERIDVAGLVKIAEVVNETVEYLAYRQHPLTSMLLPEKKESEKNTDHKASSRKVMLGTIPDYTYAGQGVKISGVIPESPAEKAGLQAGDLIVRVDNYLIGDLITFSNILKKLDIDDNIKLTFMREGKEQTVRLIAAPR